MTINVNCIPYMYVYSLYRFGSSNVEANGGKDGGIGGGDSSFL